MLRGTLDTPLYRFIRWVTPPLWRAFFGFKVRGLNTFPTTGPVVVACNHISNLDPLILGAATPRQIHFMTKSEVWKVPLLGWVVDRLGAFKVRRGQADREAIRKGIAILNAGEVIGIFPEGHRQKSGRLGTPQPGVGLFSLQPGVMTVPVVITGSNRILRGRPLLPRITVTFGPPLQPGAAGGGRSQQNREMTRRIMCSLAVLLGQDWDREIHG